MRSTRPSRHSLRSASTTASALVFTPIEGIHQLLLDLRATGTAILLVSEELDELMAIADRLLVMYEGRVTAAFDVPNVSDVDEIGLYMTGGVGSGGVRQDPEPGLDDVARP